MNESQKEANFKKNLPILTAVGFGVYGCQQANLATDGNQIISFILYCFGGYGVGVLFFYILKSIQAILIGSVVLIISAVAFRERIKAMTGADPFEFIFN